MSVIHVGENGRYVQFPTKEIELEQLPWELQETIIDSIIKRTPDGFKRKRLTVWIFAEAYVEKPHSSLGKAINDDA